MYEVHMYKTKRGDSPVKDFLGGLQIKVRAKVDKWIEYLKIHGHNLPRPYADYLRDKIYELRISHGKLEIRLLYFFWNNNIIIVTNGFFKKIRETDPKEIDKAINYMNDFISRQEVR